MSNTEDIDKNDISEPGITEANNKDTCNNNDECIVDGNETTVNIEKTESRQSLALTRCSECSMAAMKKGALKCHMCSSLVHYHCTRLPPYMIHVFVSSAKRYVCEKCAETPVDFLRDLITRSNPEIIETEEKVENTQVIVNGLETRLNDLCILVEKFDIQGISDKLHTAFEKIEKTNNKLDENVARLIKERNSNKDNNNVKDVQHVRYQNKEEDLAEIKMLKEEVSSLKNSYELMIKTVNEKDKLIKSDKQEKDKYISKIQEKDKYIHQIRADADKEKSDSERNIEIVTEKYKEVLRKEEYLSRKEGELNRDIHKYKKDIETSQTKFCAQEFEMQLKISKLTDSCKYATEKVQTNQEIINILKEQLSEAHLRNKNLEKKMPAFSGNHQEKQDNENVEATDNISRPQVVILHDSLCKNINDTILSREKIKTEKINAPTLPQMINTLDTIEKVEVIVLQALTRDVTNTEVEEILVMVDNAVKKACTKAKKVVVSTIVERDDDDTPRMKADLINASIKMKYLGTPQVLICDNKNLSFEKYRLKDGIHLTPRGTSLLAGNLKTTIAKALEITVEKREGRDEWRYDKYDKYDNYNRNDSRNYNRNDGRNDGYHRNRRDNRYNNNGSFR